MPIVSNARCVCGQRDWKFSGNRIACTHCGVALLDGSPQLSAPPFTRGGWSGPGLSHMNKQPRRTAWCPWLDGEPEPDTIDTHHETQLARRGTVDG
jgi:hypothetical protein